MYGGGFDQYAGAHVEATCKFGLAAVRALSVAQAHMVCVSPPYFAPWGNAGEEGRSAAPAGTPWAHAGGAASG